MATEKVDLSPSAMNTIFSEINTKLLEIKSKINDIEGASTETNKKYLTPQEIEDEYGLKRSLQAKLRMDKEYGPPYIRPGGCRIVLYSREEFDEWLKKWRTK